MRALGTRRNIRELKLGLDRSEKIVYTENGNRATSAAAALRRVMPILASVGITRVADISQLTPGQFPVFQSSRPGILFHSSAGQNTGAQGKGLTRVQAQISCVMETIENICMEPRCETLIRGSYDFLRHQHAILPPWWFPLQNDAARPSPKEPFVWTQSLLLDANESVLVPAEHVYFPFLPRDYSTRPTFSSTSKGVAAGTTYLEAAIHAIYELIERYYYGLWDSGKIRAHAVITEELDKVPDIHRLRNAIHDEFEMEVLALRIPGLKNLPMFVCWLVRPDGAWLYGSGCAPSFNMAIQRAVSEAVQAYTVLASGTREDVATPTFLKSLKNFPGTQILTRQAYLKTAHDIRFSALQQEYRFLRGWLKRAGFPIITITNLSRCGLDVPVVRASVPGLCGQVRQGYGVGCTTSGIYSKRFRFERAKR